MHEAEEPYKVSVLEIHRSWNTADWLRDLSLIRSELTFYKTNAVTFLLRIPHKLGMDLRPVLNKAFQLAS